MKMWARRASTTHNIQVPKSRNRRSALLAKSFSVFTFFFFWWEIKSIMNRKNSFSVANVMNVLWPWKAERLAGKCLWNVRSIDRGSITHMNNIQLDYAHQSSFCFIAMSGEFHGDTQQSLISNRASPQVSRVLARSQISCGRGENYAIDRRTSDCRVFPPS